jgi:hypothetical protein
MKEAKKCAGGVWLCFTAKITDFVINSVFLWLNSLPVILGGEL